MSVHTRTLGQLDLSGLRKGNKVEVVRRRGSRIKGTVQSLDLGTVTVLQDWGPTEVDLSDVHSYFVQ